jgi:hypothetical protein
MNPIAPLLSSVQKAEIVVIVAAVLFILYIMNSLNLFSKE